MVPRRTVQRQSLLDGGAVSTIIIVAVRRRRLFEQLMAVRKAVIPVAGLGTRFLPVTRAVPKALIPVLDTPVLQYAVEEVAKAGIERIALVVSPHQQQIGKYFDRFDDLERALERQGKAAELREAIGLSTVPEIHSICQTEQRGPGDAVLSAKSFVGNEPFAVVLPDDLIFAERPTIGDMIEIQGERGGAVIAVNSVADESIPYKGIVAPGTPSGRMYDIHGLVEKPAIEDAPSNLAIVGRYVLPPEIFSLLEGVEPGANGEIQLTDALEALLDTQRCGGYRFPGELFDTGEPLGMLKASIRTALTREDMADEVRAFIRDLTEEESSA